MLTEITISYYPHKVPAGFPSPANDYLEERIDLNKEFVKHPLSTFMIESEGDSMKQAYIPGRAQLLIDRSVTAKNGDIVLAVLNGEFTVKYLKKTDFKCWLVPANPAYKEIEVTPEMNLQVWGVIIKIFIDPKDIACLPW